MAKTKKMKEEYEELKKVSTEGKLSAENKYRNFKMEGMSHSPKFRKLRTVILLLEKAITRKKMQELIPDC